LSISGTWSNSCVPQFQRVTILQGNVIRVDAVANPNCAFCLSAVTDYHFTTSTFTVSSSGVYTVQFYVTDCTTLLLDQQTNLNVSVGCTGPFSASLTATPSTVAVGNDFVLAWCDPSFYDPAVDRPGIAVQFFRVFYGSSVSGPFQVLGDLNPPFTAVRLIPNASEAGVTYFKVEAHGNFSGAPLTTNFVTINIVNSLITFSAKPSSVNEGDPTTLTWSAPGATAVSIDNGVGTNLKTSGSQPVTPLQTTTYTLTAAGISPGTATAKVTVTPPAFPLQAAIRAVPNAVQAGQPVTLVWSTAGATSATLDGVSVELSASKTVNPSQTTTYKLTARNGTQSSDGSTTVTVTTVPAPQISTFTATPASTSSGQQVTLSWATTGAASVAIDNGVGGVQTSGSVTVTPAATTIYALTASGPGGRSTKTAQVVVSVRPPSIVTTYGTAGVTGTTDGTSAVLFNQPAALSVDDVGNIYVLDSGNHAIRRINPSGLTVTWVGQAGKSGFQDGLRNAALFDFTGFSGGMFVSGAGQIKVTDHSGRLRNVDANGNVTTCLGASCGSKILVAGGILDSSGNYYEAESPRNRIIKTPKGTTAAVPFAGSGDAGSTNGQGIASSFNNPRGLVIDASNNLDVGDTGNNAIRKISPGGLVTTFATGFSFGCCGGAITIDKQGNLYVADPGSNTIKRVTASGIVQTLIGSGAAGSGAGEGIQASFQSPNGIAIGPDGSIIISDTGNGTIRKTTPVAPTTTKRRAVSK
jgi:sugar lactone lactonase YvrE